MNQFWNSSCLSVSAVNNEIRMIASCPVEKTPEMDEVLNLLERIYEDGVVMPEEHDELMGMLKKSFQSRGSIWR